MAFDFSYREYELLKQRCPFTDEELEVFELRRRGYSVVHISAELYKSTATIDRRIKSIKRKISKELDNL